MSDFSAAGFTTAVEVAGVDPLAGEDWDRCVAGHPEAGPFHSSAWARVLARTYGHRPCYLRFHRAGLTVALMPLMDVASRLTGRRGVSLPFADACDLLLFAPVSARLILDVLQRLGVERGWRHVELRGSGGVPDSVATSASFVTHDLDLQQGIDALWDGFEPAVQRAVRKAERDGVTVELRDDRTAMEAFIRLHARTRRRHGLPPQPDRFFHAILEEIIEPGAGTIALAHQSGSPVAAAVFFASGARALYKFGASDERAQSCRANNLAMWHGMRWAIRHGATSLSFGRTAIEQDGLRRFKCGWGAAESSLNYFTVTLPEAWWSGPRERRPGLASVVFSHLPLAVNRLLGAAIYPHLD
ncbi:MAG: lipid II:glycine glycyltransferase FemX [Verrucomicrobiales bacterium]